MAAAEALKFSNLDELTRLVERELLQQIVVLWFFLARLAHFEGQTIIQYLHDVLR